MILIMIPVSLCKDLYCYLLEEIDPSPHLPPPILPWICCLGKKTFPTINMLRIAPAVGLDWLPVP